MNTSTDVEEITELRKTLAETRARVEKLECALGETMARLDWLASKVLQKKET